ncbi:MAG: glycine oxidase ThiO [Terriglobales bacterium]
MDCEIAIIGAGLIGLSLARELRRRGFEVVVFDAGDAARQASWAGAGMLAARQTSDRQLRPLAMASARLYPTWAAELERETGMTIGYRPGGALFLANHRHPAPDPRLAGWERLDPAQLAKLEPQLRLDGGGWEVWRIGADHSVDNRALAEALLVSVRARGVQILEHTAVTSVSHAAQGLAVAVAEGKQWRARVVVNAAGAWASAIAAPVAVAVRPRKGQMLRLRASVELHHVIEADNVYLVPRAHGRILVGSTVEDCGFAPGVEPAVIGQLRQHAITLVPALADAEVEESWFGFRPCSADERPVFGPTACPGYWLATGHYRDGILLAPITAKILASAIVKGQLTRALDLTPFLPQRFLAA